ncbi:MAG: carbon-nitrogen hydrolase family protein [Sedimentisphaerales bacterium]|nr:carbon-nitrogen hydrolase family protein [Sedimentisphaerales bacterium]
MSYADSNISRRTLMSRGVLAVGSSVMAACSTSAAGVSFARHEGIEKGPGCLRVAACQILTYPDVGKSTEKVVGWIEAAAKDGVDVISFPEACLCGYPEGDYWKTARPEDFQKGETLIIEASKRLDIAVVLGTIHWESEKIYNDVLVIDKGGKVRGRYSKTHLAEAWPAPGRTLPVYDVAGVKSCFIICHDVRYPELVRLPAVAGAQICYFSSHESGLREEYKLSAYRAMPIARATENSIFCIMANAPAEAKTLRGSHGNSKIIHPDGNVLLEAGHFEERLVTANIRLSDASRSIARRAADDETILKQWLNDGAKLVSVYD